MNLNDLECEVLIIGAGPVGLIGAIDLAQRGVDVIVVDQRTRFESLTVRCNHISSRSMEIFRRLGFSDRVRQGGFDDHFPHDVSIRTTTTGPEIGRIKIPSRHGRTMGELGPDGWWPTVEPPHRMNQIFLEPILQEVAGEIYGLRLQFDRKAVNINDLGETVLVEVQSSDGSISSVTCKYLIGCDGAGSLVRKAIGAQFEGDAVIQRVQSSYIHAPGLTKMMHADPCWCVLNLNPRRSGTLYTIDNNDKFLVHNYLHPDEEFNTLNRDENLRIILGVDKNFDYQLLANEDWVGRRLVSNKIANGRIFLAGDAAHIWVPMAGYGMNAGIADVTGLSWILDAKLKGWAYEGILNAYAAERLPITHQVSHFAMETAEKMIRNRAAIPIEIEEDTPAGISARTWFGRNTRDLNTPQYCCAGLNYGYYYDNSPIIAYDKATPPSYSMSEYTPSTVPGCRMAHVIMSDGSSLYDHLGKGYSLVRTAHTMGKRIIHAASKRDIPLSVVDLPRSDLHELPLYLVRPDQHVAWRGKDEPSNPDAILNTLCGIK
jgi:2-polyprenyl-6-methoxyphenol hydroxylase-like FAD-dependent oxidoreductase